MDMGRNVCHGELQLSDFLNCSQTRPAVTKALIHAPGYVYLHLISTWHAMAQDHGGHVQVDDERVRWAGGRRNEDDDCDKPV